MRIAGGASGVLVGLYLADLANRGAHVDAALVGTLGAMSFGAELLFAVPTGMLSDAMAPLALITGGAFLGAVPRGFRCSIADNARVIVNARFRRGSLRRFC
jgi:hypothetical protein